MEFDKRVLTFPFPAGHKSPSVFRLTQYSGDGIGKAAKRLVGCKSLPRIFGIFLSYFFSTPGGCHSPLGVLRKARVVMKFTEAKEIIGMVEGVPEIALRVLDMVDDVAISDVAATVKPQKKPKAANYKEKTCTVCGKTFKPYFAAQKKCEKCMTVTAGEAAIKADIQALAADLARG